MALIRTEISESLLYMNTVKNCRAGADGRKIAENTFPGIFRQKIHIWGQNFPEMVIGGLQMVWNRFFPQILVKRHKNDAM